MTCKKLKALDSCVKPIADRLQTDHYNPTSTRVFSVILHRLKKKKKKKKGNKNIPLLLVKFERKNNSFPQMKDLGAKRGKRY